MIEKVFFKNNLFVIMLNVQKEWDCILKPLCLMDNRSNSNNQINKQIHWYKKS